MEFRIYYWQELPFHPPGPAHGLKEEWVMAAPLQGEFNAQCWSEIHIFLGVAIKPPWRKLFLGVCKVTVWLGWVLVFRVQWHIRASESRAAVPLDIAGHWRGPFVCVKSNHVHQHGAVKLIWSKLSKPCRTENNEFFSCWTGFKSILWEWLVFSSTGYWWVCPCELQIKNCILLATVGLIVTLRLCLFVSLFALIGTLKK